MIIVSSIQYRDSAACAERNEARMEEIGCVFSGVSSTTVWSGISERQLTLTTTGSGLTHLLHRRTSPSGEFCLSHLSELRLNACVDPYVIPRQTFIAEINGTSATVE